MARSKILQHECLQLYSKIHLLYGNRNDSVPEILVIPTKESKAVLNSVFENLHSLVVALIGVVRSVYPLKMLGIFFRYLVASLINGYKNHINFSRFE